MKNTKEIISTIICGVIYSVSAVVVEPKYSLHSQIDGHTQILTNTADWVASAAPGIVTNSSELVDWLARVSPIKAAEDVSGEYTATTQGERGRDQVPPTPPVDSVARRVNDTVAAKMFTPVAYSNGLFSFVNGYKCEADGAYSHAEGYETYANGDYSHAEGYWTEARGKSSHVEGGWNTKALGEYSHAEGWCCEARGFSSHAEGNGAIAEAGHAEGFDTKSSGAHSHAEGNRSVSVGRYSHAEGWSSASGEGAHSEGSMTGAQGEYSHAEGYATCANGIYSHAEGFMSQANGDYSHAEGGGYGEGTKATGKYAHAEGKECIAGGEFSHAEGWQTQANGVGSRAAGSYTIAEAHFSCAEGRGAKTKQDDMSSYCWNGDDYNWMYDTPYESNGKGTYNINPKGGLTGFFIGTNSLDRIIQNAILSTLKKAGTDGIIIDGVRYMITAEVEE